MMRALRPDRMTYAVQGFIEEKLGSKFVENRSVEFCKSFEESGEIGCFQHKTGIVCCTFSNLSYKSLSIIYEMDNT